MLGSVRGRLCSAAQSQHLKLGGAAGGPPAWVLGRAGGPFSVRPSCPTPHPTGGTFSFSSELVD